MAHLHELRRRLMIGGGALLAASALSLLIAPDLVDLLSAPARLVLDGEEPRGAVDDLYLLIAGPILEALGSRKAIGQLVLHGSLEGVYTYLRVALMSGAVMTSPVLAYQVWSFIAPGLYKQERRAVVPLAVASTSLFLLGAAFAYVVILPVAFSLFMTILEADAMVSIDDAIRTVVKILLAFGLCYQLPVIVWFLARMGLIDHRDMIKGFRYSVVGIFAIAAMLTPPDILTQVLLGVPLIILYGVGIIVAKFATTKVRNSEAD